MSSPTYRYVSASEYLDCLKMVQNKWNQQLNDWRKSRKYLQISITTVTETFLALRAFVWLFQCVLPHVDR